MEEEADEEYWTETATGMVDYKGRKARRSRTGGWRSASFIMGAGMAEKIAYSGTSSNLITYLTGPMGQSTATASENVNTWTGTVSMLPLLGAFVADSFLGHYRTIAFSSLLYVLGLGMLTISAALISTSQRACNQHNSTKASCPSSPLEVILFFSSLYICAIALGGFTPSIEAFGANQFDEQHSEECKSKSIFFNWWGFMVCLGFTISYLTLLYIQEHLSWVLGFGIPCAFTVLGLFIFLLGTKTYRYDVEDRQKSPFFRIIKVFSMAIKRAWRSSTRSSLTTYQEVTYSETSLGTTTPSHQIKFLQKASTDTSNHEDGSILQEGEVLSMNQEKNEANGILCLVPIWCTSLIYAVFYAQASTLFTKQGSTMERNIGSNIQIPAASINTFTTMAFIVFLPIYDRILVPFARTLTGIPNGITTLQRIGVGIFIATISMAIAAVIESKRLKTALDYGLVDDGQAIVPMSIWWLIPQYALSGIAEVFSYVGLQEFFYDQVSKELKTLGTSFHMSIIGVGNFLSSFLIFVVKKETSANGRDNWFSDNLNRGHLDYFYWLLTGLGIAGLSLYMYFAKLYIYK